MDTKEKRGGASDQMDPESTSQAVDSFEITEVTDSKNPEHKEILKTTRTRSRYSKEEIEFIETEIRNGTAFNDIPPQLQKRFGVSRNPDAIKKRFGRCAPVVKLSPAKRKPPASPLSAAKKPADTPASSLSQWLQLTPSADARISGTQMKHRAEELAAELEGATQRVQELERTLLALAAERSGYSERYVSAHKMFDEHRAHVREAAGDVVRRLGALGRIHSHERNETISHRIGRLALTTDRKQRWEEGLEWRALTEREGDLLQQQREIKAERMSIQYAKAPELIERREVLRYAEASVADKLKQIEDKREQLMAEKYEYIAEARRIQCESRCLFHTFPAIPRAVDKAASDAGEEGPREGRFQLLKLLGKGGWSEVYLAYDLEEFQQVAVKVHVPGQGWDAGLVSRYWRHTGRELQIQSSLDHPNIVKIYSVFPLGEEAPAGVVSADAHGAPQTKGFVTVLEYCAGGDLRQHLQQHAALRENKARVIFREVCNGLKYLHDNSIIHFDLKPGNILFSRLGEIKIADFGLSKRVEPSESSAPLTSIGCGTHEYLPREATAPGPNPRVSSKVDIWSAGIVLHELLFGRRPFSKQQLARAWEPLPLPDFARQKPAISADCRDLLTRMLAQSPELRPDVDAVLAHKWFQKK